MTHSTVNQLIASTSVLMVVTMCCGWATSQEIPQQNESVNEIEFAEPFSNGLNSKMKEFLAMKVENGRLVLIKAWPSAHHVPDGEFNRRRYSTSSAFSQAARELGCNRSGAGYSLADKTVNDHTTGQTHSAQLIADDRAWRFIFWRNAAPFQRFSFEEEEQGVLRLLYVSDGDVVHLHQLPDGKVNLKVVFGSEAKVFSATNYEEFAQKHRDATEQVLFPLLNHLGIGIPIDLRSPEVKDFVVEQVQFARKFYEVGFDKVAADLESRDFETRKAANDLIKQGMNLWHVEIEDYIADDSKSVLSRAFLKTAIRKKKTNRLQKFVAEQGLLKSKDYLFGVIKDSGADARDAIFQHLLLIEPDIEIEQLTEQYRAWSDKND